jgi:FecR protein
MFGYAGDVPGDNAVAKPAFTAVQAIGTIQSAIGSTTVTRADAVVVRVDAGDPVYQGDVIETAADGAIAITFNDGSAFRLSAGARMALDEFICDPDGTANSARFSITRGIFAFIAGRAAKSGKLSIDTPVARIRGAARGGGGTGMLTLAALTFAVMDELQAYSDFTIQDGVSIPLKELPHGIFDIVTWAGQRILADDPGVTIQIDAAGSITRIPLSAARVAELAQLAYAVALLADNPGASLPGSGSPFGGGAAADHLLLLPIEVVPVV